MNEKAEQSKPTREELTGFLWPYTEQIKSVPPQLKGNLISATIAGYGGDIHLSLSAFKILFDTWDTHDEGSHWTLSSKLNGVRVLAITRRLEETGP